MFTYPLRVRRGYVHYNDRQFPLVKVEPRPNGLFAFWFNVDGVLHVGIGKTVRGLTTISCSKIDKNQDFSRFDIIPERRALLRIAGTDYTRVGKKKIRLKRKFHMIDEEQKQPIAVESLTKQEYKRLKRFENNRTPLGSVNTARITTIHSHIIQPVSCPTVTDEAGNNLAAFTIDNPTYDTFKCPACRTDRKEMGYCESCVEKTEQTLQRLNRELSK